MGPNGQVSQRASERLSCLELVLVRFELWRVHRLKAVVLTSPECRQDLLDMGPALHHHYANNRHHPQYSPLGVAGMTLADVIEMSSYRHVAR